jgi:hypothetical protein
MNEQEYGESSSRSKIGDEQIARELQEEFDREYQRELGKSFIQKSLDSNKNSFI